MIKHAKVTLLPDKGPASQVLPSDWNAEHTVDFSAFGIPSPLSFPDCGLWLDASQLAGFADGDPVASWPDLSGNAYHATQAVGASQPTYKTNIVNGLPIVRFLETDPIFQHLALSGLGLDLFRDIAGCTIAGVYGNILFTNHGCLLVASDGTDIMLRRIAVIGGSSLGFLAGRVDGVESDVAEVHVSDPASPLGSLPGPVAFIASADFAGGNILVAVSARYASDAAGNDPIFGDLPGLTPDTPSLAVFVGACPDLSSSLTGDIAEIVVYRRVLTLRERRLLLEYLSAKWGAL